MKKMRASSSLKGFWRKRAPGSVGRSSEWPDWKRTWMPGRASRMPEGETLAAFAATGATLAIHLAIHALDKVVEEVTPFYGADCPVAVVAHASWPEERILRGTLGDICAKLAEAPIERTALILVGRALAARDFRDSALYDADYRRRFRGGAA